LNLNRAGELAACAEYEYYRTNLLGWGHKPNEKLRKGEYIEFHL